MSLRPLIAIAAACLTLLALAQPALASRTQESIFQDDRLLAGPDLTEQRRTLDLLQALGVDTIRTTVPWRWLSPDYTSSVRPEGFDATNPASYRALDWERYDALVRRAQARGMEVLMSPAGPVPNWGSQCTRNRGFACEPDPERFGEFVQALGTRYSGSYSPAPGEPPLPRVSRWSLWNEPNLESWLLPQYRRVRGKRIPTAAAWYRKLFRSGYSALAATGHGSDQVLIGETAPLGTAPRNTAPADFLRHLFCIDGRGRALRGRAARRLECTRGGRLKATGLAHHPYARGAGAPLSRKQRRGMITSGTIGRLLPIIRAARKRSKVAPRRTLSVYLTEFGISTRPPDTKFGVRFSQQAELLNRADFVAFQRPWIRSVAQFVLQDDTGGAVSFQTGLLSGDGRAKPSLHAYRLPLVVNRRGSRVYVFGQARPARGVRTRLAIQNDPPGRRSWRTVATRSTNARGYLYTKLRARRGAWRLQWTEPSGAVSYSRVVGGRTRFPAVPGFIPPEPQHVLTVRVELFGDLVFGPASGRVTSEPAGIDCGGGDCTASYVEDTSVTLTATPGPGTVFEGWSGGGCGGTGPCTVPMSEARFVSAAFRRTGL